MNNKRLRITLSKFFEQGSISEDVFLLDCYNMSWFSDVAFTIRTRVDASNCAYLMVVYE